MKIDFKDINQEQFMMHDHELCGETVTLIQPQHIGCKWTQANKHLRSSVWNSDGELISMGLPKFTNWGENPDNFPVPTSLDEAVAVEKMDGSLLIVSKYKGEFILRTRGTVDASRLDNGHEIAKFKEQYPEVFKYQPHMDTWEFSLLFEWTSPDNRIVISYGPEPKLTYLGGIYHDNLRVFDQSWVAIYAKQFGCGCPRTFSFLSIEQMMSEIEGWKGTEGVVIYSNEGGSGRQALHKVKSLDYLVKHRMKDELGSFDRLVDFFMVQGRKSYDENLAEIEDVFDFDFEKMTQIKKDLQVICDSYQKVLSIIAGMSMFNKMVLRPKDTRKAQALEVIKTYQPRDQHGIMFKLLDGKELDDKDWKKLLYQVVENGK